MLESIKLKNGNTLEIYQDMSSESPREWDNVTKLVCFHKRYALGDCHDVDHDDYNSWNEMRESITNKNDLVVKLYLYDHSGITIATSPFHCKWDSGQVGFAIITEAQIKEEFDGDVDKAAKCLEAEVKTYDQYLRGETYGYILKDNEDNDLDSCWGFFGDDPEINGIFDAANIKIDDVA